jgi:methyl-accepting chemotaxis protein
MSLKTRSLVARLFILLCSMVSMEVVSVNVAVSESNDAHTKATKERLISQNVQTGEAINEYFKFITSLIRTKSFNVSVINAAEKFIPAFNQYVYERCSASASEKRLLENYCSSDFTQQYNGNNPEKLADAASAFDGVSQTALAFQYDFTAGSSFVLGEKDGLTNLANNSTYAQLHNKYHPDICQFL